MSESLFIQELFHGVIAIPFAFLLYSKTKSIKYALAVIFFTYAIDADHLIDYVSYYGIRLDLVRFLSADYFEYTKRAFVFFHAWEFVVILYIRFKRVGWKTLTAVLMLSLAAHLIYDTITVRSIPFYFLIYRISRGFTNLN